MIGRENRYLDWRIPIDQQDIDFARNIVDCAWRNVLAYLQQQWSDTLIPALGQTAG